MVGNNSSCIVRNTQYDYGKEANQGLQKDVIYLVYVSRAYLPPCPAEADR